MVQRTAEAEWRGGLQDGSGTMKLGSGAYEGAYSFNSRFAEGTGTNPEELIAAAHAGCFSMALSAGLARAGFPPKRVHTNAKATLEKTDSGFAITRIELQTEAEVPGIEEAAFQEQADAAKRNCPVSRALAGTNISLNARLVR
jgi:osmotically inducible protein OsmC